MEEGNAECADRETKKGVSETWITMLDCAVETGKRAGRLIRKQGEQIPWPQPSRAWWRWVAGRPRSPRIGRLSLLPASRTSPSVLQLQLNRKTFVVWCCNSSSASRTAPNRQERDAQAKTSSNRELRRAGGQARRRWAGLPWSCFELELGDHRILWGTIER